MPAKKDARPRPTEAELELLRVLWDRGAATVREIHSALHGNGKDTGYTTTLKILQKMTEKGLVQRDERERSHIYRATAPAESTQRGLVSDLLHRAFGGSALRMVQQALSEKPVTPAELTAVRKLLIQIEKEDSTRKKS